MYRFLMRGGIAVVAATAVALVSVHGRAAKPPSGGGPPPAAGRIYFDYGNQPYSMNGSGGNKTPLTASAAPGFTPSRLRYSGGRRWSLFVAQTGTYDRVVNADGSVRSTDSPHYDLFASRPDGSGGTQVLQITDLYGVCKVVETLQYGYGAWSNDGQDSFVSFAVRDVTDAFQIAEDGATEVDFDDVQSGVVRINVSGADLDAAANSGTWTPVGPLDEEWEIAARSTNLAENNFKHSWSPDGTMVAYLLNFDELYVTDVPTGATLQLLGPTNYAFTSAPQWQPGGDQIAFINGATLWVADAFGGGTQPVLETDAARWSPDGNHFVFRSTVRKGTRYEYQLQRHDMSTGSKYMLTSDLDKSQTKVINDWLID